MITTGNLRRTAKAFFVDTSAPRDPRALQEALVFASICAAFALGAAAGAATTRRLVNIGLVVPIGFWGRSCGRAYRTCEDEADEVRVPVRAPLYVLALPNATVSLTSTDLTLKLEY